MRNSQRITAIPCARRTLLRLTHAVMAAALLLPAPATAGFGDCGQPLTGGAEPSTTDALGVLRAAVGIASCAICVCDATGDGMIASADALRVLKSAVGQNTRLECLVCRNSATIGPAGGTLVSKDASVAIVFPPGAVDEETEVSIEGAARSDLGAALFANKGASAWRLEPESLELHQDLTVSVNRDDAVIGGAGTFGAKLLLFLSRHDGVVEGLADQRVHVEGGQADATATLSRLSLLAVIPLDISARVTGVPAQTVPEQTHSITALVSVGDGEKVVSVADAHFVDDDFGAWQTADGFALDDPLEETIDGFFGDSYDYVCTQEIHVGFNSRIVTTLDVTADIASPPVGIETTMAFSTTILCEDP